MKRQPNNQSNSTTLGQLPTFADYRRMRLLQPRRDFPTPDKEAQEQIKTIKAEIKAAATEESAGKTQDTVPSIQTTAP